MQPLPLAAELEQVAHRVIWFEDPAQALSDPVRIIAYAMTCAVHEDMNVIRRHVSDDELREALNNTPPGTIDPRSWNYWHLKLGRHRRMSPPLALGFLADTKQCRAEEKRAGESE